ncbi:MAG: glycine--tRNA ligase subunit beta [Coriobacteriales bacterium]|nr:glycine--tRNA ligase subunit beta [Coriobacteriales bacterium]
MANKRDFLLEIGCEEMPSAPLMKAQDQLGKLVAKGLDASGLSHGEVRTLSTPRRLAVLVAECATATEEINEVVRGPKAQIAFDAGGNPTRAAQGFARKNGTTPEALVRRVEPDGNEYVFAERSIASVPAIELLSELCERTIASIQWPNYRSQRWGSEHATFVRPIRWICALLGEEVVPVRYADVTSGNTTRGHRVLAPGAHVVAEPATYEDVLEQSFVLGELRRAQVIREGIARLEEERGGAHVDTPKGTFDEVVNLCEWPSVVVGTFDEEFLAVPQEIIVEAMLKHQRYFPVYAADGSLTREFVIVSNADPAVNDTVCAGNERVVRPRLDDAKFFYDEDLKVGLSAFRERLANVVFQKRLGTVLQKTERMEVIASSVAGQAGLGEEVVVASERAAHLAKADLVSQAVVEFTSQQGVMGGYYAAAQGEDDLVAQAISQHYRPRFAGDELPSTVVGKSVAIADKLDTICGMFAINEPPTGSSDPFAVRRSAIGVIAMLRTLPQVSLRELIDVSLAAYVAQGLEFDVVAVAAEVRAYFSGRLAAIAREEGAEPDTIKAVSAIGVCDPVAYLSRVKALDTARRDSRELFDDLATAYARASHLADASLGTSVDATLLGDAERALLEAVDAGSAAVQEAIESANMDDAIASLAKLREPIDQFFEDVLVMDQDLTLRENRLKLLNRFEGAFKDVANIGALAKGSK